MDNALRNIADRLAAGIGLALFSPLMAAAALAVWMEDGLPILFRQTRVGRGARPFTLLKFRSMRNHCPGLKITAGRDPRVTTAGRVLRKFKLDELPQLWNVVRGDMSLVGPRPEVPEYIDLGNPVWRTILRVRPGITDLATLVYRNEEELLAVAADADAYYRRVLLPAKLRLNLRYLAIGSWLPDLKLLLMTVRYSFLPAGFDPAAVERSFSPKDPKWKPNTSPSIVRRLVKKRSEKSSPPCVRDGLPPVSVPSVSSATSAPTPGRETH